MMYLSDDRVDVRESGCWVWTGGLASGIAVVYEGGKKVCANHALWQWSGRGSAKGIQLTNKPGCEADCVNPSHLLVKSWRRILKTSGLHPKRLDEIAASIPDDLSPSMAREIATKYAVPSTLVVWALQARSELKPAPRNQAAAAIPMDFWNG